jgi:hypothetical protein
MLIEDYLRTNSTAWVCDPLPRSSDMNPLKLGFFHYNFEYEWMFIEFLWRCVIYEKYGYDFDTHKFKFLTNECDYGTLKCEFYTQSVIFTLRTWFNHAEV